MKILFNLMLSIAVSAILSIYSLWIKPLPVQTGKLANPSGEHQSPQSIPTPPPYWKRVTSPDLPPPRVRSTFAFFPPQNTGYLFGGYNSNQGLLSDTWAIDGQDWTEYHPVDTPQGRIDAAFAYDESAQVLVLFGGNGNERPFGDTWTFDGLDWIQQQPANSPSPRHRSSMVYDVKRNATILLGGMNAAGKTLDEIWIWDGITWQQQFPAIRPPARWGASMVYDPTQESIVLYGGADSEGLLGDTWLWNGTTWSQQFPVHSPGDRVDFGMAYDTSRGQVILFGGQTTADIIYPDTWTWDGATWTQLPTSFEPPNGMAFGANLIYMLETGDIIVYNTITEKTSREDGMFFYFEHSDVWSLIYPNLIYFSYFDSYFVR